MKKQVLINVEDKDIRVAVLEDGILTQLFFEKDDGKSIVGNLYKARVESIVPGLNAAFVDIGIDRNAFLHFSDIPPDYTVPGSQGSSSRRRGGGRGKGADAEKKAADEGDSQPEDGEKPAKSAGKTKKEEVRVGTEFLVQVSKDPISTKGARVTGHISLPGRYLVYLPNSEKDGGVSRRIENAAERLRLRTILKGFGLRKGSFIIRTAGLDQDEEDITADVKTLRKTWDRTRRRSAAKKGPSLIHDDHDIVARLVRDEFTKDIEEIVVDSKDHARELRRALDSMMPDLKKKVIVHEGDDNLFDRYEVEHQFQKALRPRVALKSGGSIVIDEAEALVAIDVNSGKFVGKTDKEAMILTTNLEAAEVIAQQLRLRDVGGIIVIDFIDMRSRENQQKLLLRLKDLLKKDRAKNTVTPITEYGLLTMTRKRVRESLAKAIYRKCPHCQGSGRVLTETQVWKNIKYEILSTLKGSDKVRTVQITVHPDIRKYMENNMLEAARGLANRCNVALNFVDDKEYHLEHFDVITVAKSGR